MHLLTNLWRQKKGVELDDKTFGNMIKEEIDRINAEEKAGNVAE